jgi:hypothetical protein
MPSEQPSQFESISTPPPTEIGGDLFSKFGTSVDELWDIAQPPAAMQAQHRALFENARKQALESFSHPEIQHYATMAADVIEWAWFGRNESPPEGLVGETVINTESGQPEITDRVSFAPEIDSQKTPWGIYAVHNLLCENGLWPVVKERETYLSSTMPAVREAAIRLLRLTTSYQDLVVHAIEDPLTQEERPLNQQELQSRIASLRAQAQRQAEGKPLDEIQYDPAYTAVVREFRGHSQWLDDERVRKPAKAGFHDPKKSLLADMRRRFSVGEKHQVKKVTYQKNTRFPEGAFVAEFEDGETKAHPLTEYSLQPYDDDYIGGETRLTILSRLMTQSGIDYEKALENHTHFNAYYLAQELNPLLTVSAGSIVGVSRRVHLSGMQPAKYMDRTEHEARRKAIEQWAQKIQPPSGSPSPREYRRLRKQQLGSIIEQDENGLPANRLLFWITRAEELPETHPEACLRIAWNEPKTIEKSDPYIPGYVLVSRKDNEFGFARDPAGDPYVRADVPLTDTVGKLTLRYALNGMEHLNEGMHEGMTIADLAEMHSLIARYSVRHAYRVNRLNPEARHRTFSNAALYARRGRPVHTCENAERLAGVSYETLGIESSALNGYLVPAMGRVICGLRHAQTRVIHEGRMYIVDATPRKDSWLPPLPENEESATASEHLFEPPAVHRFRREPEKLFTTPEPPNRILRSLEDRLCLMRSPEAEVTAADRRELYKRNARLPSQHPIRQTISVLRRSNGVPDWRNPTDIQEIEKTLQFVRRYSKAMARMTPDLRPHTVLPYCDPRLLSVLEHHLNRLWASSLAGAEPISE